MVSDPRDRRCTVRAPAKINLGLRVLGRRPDGYHELLTTFAAVDLYDDLTFRRTGGDGIHLTWELADPDLPAETFDTGESNLILRAVRLVEQARGFRAGLEIHLTKRIPIAAGLGGGSSDAAATLAAINRLFDLNEPSATLAEWGAALGSDVPFFLGPPCAIGRGRGERLTPWVIPESYWAALVCPNIALSAGEVYAALGLTTPAPVADTPHSFDGEGFFTAIGHVHNDLEEVVRHRAPIVSYWCEQLIALGAQGAFVSGSGPTVVGIFRESPEYGRLVERKRSDERLFIVRPVDTPMALVIGEW